MKYASSSCQGTCLGIDPGQQVATSDSLTVMTAAMGEKNADCVHESDFQSLTIDSSGM